MRCRNQCLCTSFMYSVWPEGHAFWVLLKMCWTHRSYSKVCIDRREDVQTGASLYWRPRECCQSGYSKADNLSSSLRPEPHLGRKRDRSVTAGHNASARSFAHPEETPQNLNQSRRAANRLAEETPLPVTNLMISHQHHHEHSHPEYNHHQHWSSTWLPVAEAKTQAEDVNSHCSPSACQRWLHLHQPSLLTALHEPWVALVQRSTSIT